MRCDVKLYFILFVNFLIFFTSNAQKSVLIQTNESGRYKLGDRVRMTFIIREPSVDTVTVRIIKNFINQSVQKKIICSKDSIIIFEKVINEKSTFIIQVTTRKDTLSEGFIVDAEHFQPGTKRPKDIDDFWKKEKNKLRALKMTLKIDTLKPIAEGYNIYNVEINCPGSTNPSRGYYSKPTVAKSHSLPIVLYLHAAGVKESWCHSEPNNALRFARMGNGALSFDLNAHGMLNSQSKEYYVDLENGELKNYATRGVGSKEDCYFRGMYLRLLRTIDFLTLQPEWDGKRILVIGESQGGGQALAAAGLDNRVTAAVVTVPAMCDWGGTLVGRKGCYPDPYSTSSEKEMVENMSYFDIAHILKGSKATIMVEIGLVDFTCPSSAVFAAINQEEGKKIIYTVPYRAHSMTQNIYKKVWNETVNNAKQDFINNYLK